MPPKPSSPASWGKSRKRIISLAASLLLAAILIAGDYILRVRKISVDIDEPDLKILGISKLENRRMLFLSVAEEEKLLKETNPRTVEVKISKNYPDTLLVTIYTGNRVAVLKTGTGYFVLSADGRILEKRRELPSYLPLVNFYQKLDYGFYQAGDQLDFIEIKTALMALRKAGSLGLRTNAIDIGGTHMIALKLGEKSVVFSTEKDIGDQLFQFEEIIARMKGKGLDFRKLDFRFDKPVAELLPSK